MFMTFPLKLQPKNLIVLGIEILAVVCVYAATGWLGLSMAIPPGIATPIWPPSGIALSAVLLRGKRVWLGIFLGSLLVNFKILFQNSQPVSSCAVLFCVAFASMLQAIAGAALIRYFRVLIPFKRVEDIFTFTWIEIFSCLISPTLAAASLFLGHFISWPLIPKTWWTWWTGDLVGVIVLAPFLMSWAQPFQKSWNHERLRENILYGLGLIGIIYFIFSHGSFNASTRIYVTSYALFPFVIWAAFRFDQRTVTSSVLLISVVAILGTVGGRDPFMEKNLSESSFILQSFISVLALTGFFLSVALTERRTVYDELQKSRRSLNDFFENAPLGLHWLGPNGVIIRANQAELNLLGYMKEEYVGHSITEFHVDKKNISDVLNRLINHEEFLEYEAQLRCRDGSLKDVRISSNVLWEKGHFIHTRCFTRDITDRKQAKIALMKNQVELEKRVNVRTQELSEAYRSLELEMGKRWKVQKDILEISEREQKRLGQDLHDGLAQQLSGLSLMAKTLQHKLAEKSATEEKDVVEILSFLKLAIEDVRRISRGFYPVELGNLGLFPALEQLAVNKEKMYGIPCLWQFDDSIHILDDVMAKHVYRITQEAILNAVKHGKPNQVNLSIKRVKDDVVLMIEDDGIGIDKQKLTAQMGLRIMDYRAQMIGARFSIDNIEGGGTRVTFIFKLEEPPIQIGEPLSLKTAI